MQITSKVKQWDFFSKIRIYQSKTFTAVCFRRTRKREEKPDKQAIKHTLFDREHLLKVLEITFYKKEKKSCSHHHYLWLQFFLFILTWTKTHFFKII